MSYDFYEMTDFTSNLFFKGIFYKILDKTSQILCFRVGVWLLHFIFIYQSTDISFSLFIMNLNSEKFYKTPNHFNSFGLIHHKVWNVIKFELVIGIEFDK